MKEEQSLVGEVATDEVVCNMVKMADGCNFTCMTHHPKGVKTFTLNFIKGILGPEEYEKFVRNYKNKTKIRNKITNNEERWFSSHTYICKESKEIVNNALYILIQEPGGWGGTYELLIVTKTGEVYKAEHDELFNKYILRVKQNISNKAGLFRYVKIGDLEKDYLRNDIQFRVKMKFESIMFDAISYTLYKKSGANYKLMIERGSFNASEVCEHDIAYAEKLLDKLQYMIQGATYEL